MTSAMVSRTKGKKLAKRKGEATILKNYWANSKILENHGLEM